LTHCKPSAVQSLQSTPQHVSTNPEQTPLWSAYPESQALPQLVPSQVACAFGSDGVGHGVQLDPHVATLPFDTQVLLHTWKPVAQLAHTLPAQYCVAQSDGVLHAEPTEQVLPCASQTPPQSTPVSSWFWIWSLHESATHVEPLRWNPE
jgi:hypothetical protein